MFTLHKSLALLIACVALTSIFASESFAQQRYRLDADLWPTSVEPRASGKAKFESRQDRPGRQPRMKFSAECEDLFRSSSIDVRVNGRRVGVAKVDATGFVDLNLDTDLGDTVPKMFANDRVEIVNEQGNVILGGVLRGRVAVPGAATPR